MYVILYVCMCPIFNVFVGTDVCLSACMYVRIASKQASKQAGR